jgi:uncharacterized protein YegL
MAGDPIEAVKSGIRSLHSELMGDPQTVESAYLSVITFDSTAKQICPLVELPAFQPPNLAASGTTAMGAALRLVCDCIDREVRKTTAEQKGDWKPLIFVITDGVPTDSDWQSAIQQVRARRPGNMVAVGVGDKVDTDILKQVTETVLIMKEMSPNAFSKFFKLLSQSIKQTSAKAGSAQDGPEFVLPTPPPQITMVP